jgi:hypothetical protein
MKNFGHLRSAAIKVKPAFASLFSWNLRTVTLLIRYHTMPVKPAASAVFWEELGVWLLQ